MGTASAEGLKVDASNFFKKVKLPARGITLDIRKIDIQSISEAASIKVLTGNKQAAAEELEKLQSKLQDGKIDKEALGTMMQVAETMNRMLIEESVVGFDRLLEAYQSDGTERTFGMGPDFGVLMGAIREHNGLDVSTDAGALAAVGDLLGKKKPAKRQRKRKAS